MLLAVLVPEVTDELASVTFAELCVVPPVPALPIRRLVAVVLMIEPVVSKAAEKLVP